MWLYIVLGIPVLFVIRRMFFKSSSAPDGPAPQVTIKTGTVEGELCYSTSGRIFSSFNGIPFAKAPVGKLRFLRPQPAEKWEGVKKCVKNMSFIQRNAFRAGNPQEGKEDGLVLNVSSPDLNPSRKLPVMVWIHGGGFVSGSGSRNLYGMNNFMDKDVVMVSINYRLAVLGGLYLDKDHVPGNQGLRDQILSLEWVQENIGKFGGDKDRVTIFGESAGGMSVFNLVLSPLAKGLFSAAIVMSGSPLSPFVGLDKHPRHYTNKLIEELGGNPNDSPGEIINFLQSKDAADIQGLTNMFEEFVRAPLPFKPIVDKDLVDDPVLPDEPINLIKSGRYNKVPMIIGTNRNEGLLIKAFYQRNPEKYDEAYDNWSRIGPLALFHREQDEYSQLESKLCLDYLKKHFSGVRFGPDGVGSEKLVAMYGDLMFTAPADIVTRMMLEQDSSLSLFQYIYNHQGHVSLYDVVSSKPWQLVLKFLGLAVGLKSMFKSKDGVCHGDELFMMFKGTLLPNTIFSEQDERVRKSLVDKWTSFAINHNPTSDGSWAKFDNLNPQFLEFGSDADTMKYPEDHKERMEEWKEIYRQVPCTMRHEQSATWSKQ